MDNETLVDLIRQGIDTQENLLQLYNNNLPIIRKIAKPYTAYEEESDLLQQSYFSLLEAVERYDPDKGANFLTYFIIWIKQGIVRYIEESGRTVRIPSHFLQQIFRYKKFTAKFMMNNGRYPTIEEASQKMRMPEERIEEIILYQQQAQSLDEQIQTDSDSFTLADTIASPEELEESTIDAIYADYEKIALWDICQKYLSDRENMILKERFKNRKTLQQIADQQGISRDRVRQIENKALSRLRRGKAVREIKEKIYIVESSHFNSGLRAYQEHNFTSEVERRVLRMEQIREEMKQKYGYIV